MGAATGRLLVGTQSLCSVIRVRTGFSGHSRLNIVLPLKY